MSFIKVKYLFNVLLIWQTFNYWNSPKKIIMRKCSVSFSCCHSDKIGMCRLLELLFSACEWFSNYGEGTSTIVVWMFDLFFYNLFLVSNFQQIIYIIIYFFIDARSQYVHCPIASIHGEPHTSRKRMASEVFTSEGLLLPFTL